MNDGGELPPPGFPEGGDGGELPPPDFPEGGESSLQRKALERPAAPRVGTKGTWVGERIPGTKEMAADRQAVATLEVAAGPGLDAGVGLVERE